MGSRICDIVLVLDMPCQSKTAVSPSGLSIRLAWAVPSERPSSKLRDCRIGHWLRRGGR